MKNYNIVLAVLMVLALAGSALAAVPVVTPGAVTITTDKIKTTTTVAVTDPDAGTITTYSAVSSNNTLLICSMAGNVLTAERVDGPDFATSRTGTCTVSATDNQSETGSGAITVTLEPRTMLEIAKLYVEVEGDSERLSEDDSFEAKPGDSLVFKITVENLFSGDTDEEEVEIENVEARITIEDWDDGDDEKWDSDDSIDIDYEDSEIITVTLDDIPTSISDGSHDVTIEITGRDGETSSRRHKVVWKLTMDIEKENEDIRLRNVAFEPTSVSCDRTATLHVKLENSGTRDSDEIVFEAKNSQLGISIQDYDIDLDEGDSTSKEYQVTVPKSAAPGTYAIRVSTYFDMDDFEDQDVSNTNTVQLTVSKCEETTTTTTTKPTTTEPKQNTTTVPEVVVVTPPVQQTEEPEVTEPIKQESWFTGTNLLIIGGLVLLNLLLLIGIIVIIGKLVSRR